MDIDIVAWCPAGVSESLNWEEFIPFTWFCIINFKGNNLSNLVGSATNNHHQWTEKQGWVLISWNWTFCLVLVRSFNPVPSSISVSSQAPSVKQTALICCSPSKAYHHACCTSCLAQSCRVINSHLRRFSPTVEFNPRKWSFFNTKTPNITDCFLTGIASKYEEMRLGEYNWMSVPSTWSRAHNGNNHPLGLVFTISHVQKIQVITCKTPTARSSSVHDHLHLLYICWSMCSSRRWRHAFNI